MMHVLLDTNVPLNLLLNGYQERPLPVESALVLDHAAKDIIHAYITPVSFHVVFYFVMKAWGRAHAIKACGDLLDQLRMVGQDESVFRNALGSGWADVEDAGQYFAAKADPRITHLCTTNHKHYKASKGIAIVSPAALLKLL